MNSLTYAVIGGLMATCAVSAFLVFHKDYEDGLFGRIFLVLIMFGSGMMVGQAVHWRYPIDPSVGIYALAVAGFMMRHGWRFWRWRHNPEKFQWKKISGKGVNTQPGIQQ